MSVEAKPIEGDARLAHKLPWFSLAAAGLAADLWTKHLVFYPDVLDPKFAEYSERGPWVVGHVCSWWRTILAYNRGVTFGMGIGLGAWLLSIGTGLVIVMLLRTLWRTPRGERVKSFALSIIVGGAVGNLYDRALRPFVEADTHPGVRDFLDWYVPADSALGRFLTTHNVTPFEYHWYTFNVADSFIVSGVVLLAWKVIREKPQPSVAGTAKGGAT